jgi:hypothetical protein
MAAGLHECRPEHVIERQVEEARQQLDRELGQFLASPGARNRLAFAAWCREHGR